MQEIEDAIRSEDGCNPKTGREASGAITELVKQYSKYYKVKSRNITNGQLDLVIELWVKEEEEMVERLAALPNVYSVSLMNHDGEVTF